MAKGASIQFESEEEYEEVKTVAKSKDLDFAKYMRKLARDDVLKSKGEKEPEVKQEIKPVTNNTSPSPSMTSGTGTFPIDIKSVEKKEGKQPIIKEKKKRMEEADKEEFRKMIREESHKTYKERDDEKSLNAKLDKIYEKQCQGEECMKNLEKSHSALKNEVASIKEEESCIGCSSKVRVGSSYCPTCGLKISGWSQLPDWKPTWRK